MKYPDIMLCVVLLLFISCAATERARVENGLYINPAHEFSLGVPRGWETTEEIPATIRKTMSVASKRNFKVTISDLKNMSFILISAEETETDWIDFRMYSEKFIASLDKYFSREEKEFIEKSGSRYYRYEILQDQIKNCNNKCIASNIFFHGAELKCSGHNIVYRSDHGMLYAVSLVLVSREEQYDTNLSVFGTVVDSFQHL